MEFSWIRRRAIELFRKTCRELREMPGAHSYARAKRDLVFAHLAAEFGRPAAEEFFRQKDLEENRA